MSNLKRLLNLFGAFVLPGRTIPRFAMAAVLALALAAGVAAQSTVTTSGSYSYRPIEGEFNLAYYASLKPDIRAAIDINDEGERAFLLRSMAEAGEIIDVPIHVWRWSPYYTMLARSSGGYTWVPSALQPPVIVAPGIAFPGLPMYNPDAPPPGSIKVIDPHDRAQWPAPYPKPADPPPTVPETNVRLVGAEIWPGAFRPTTAGLDKPRGFEVTEDGKRYVKQIVPNMFGDLNYWLRLP